MHIDFQYIPFASAWLLAFQFSFYFIQFAVLLILCTPWMYVCITRTNIFKEAAYFTDLFSVSHLLSHIDFFFFRSLWVHMDSLLFTLSLYTFHNSTWVFLSSSFLNKILFFTLDFAQYEKYCMLFFSTLVFSLNFFSFVVCPRVVLGRCSLAFQFTCCTSHHVMFLWLNVYLWLYVCECTLFIAVYFPLPLWKIDWSIFMYPNCA